MNQKFKTIGLPLLILILAIAAAMVAISSKQAPEKQEIKEKPFLVNAEAVRFQDLNFTVVSQGTVRPLVQTVLSAQVSGKVVDVADAFIAGGMFQQGEILVQLERADYLTDLQTAEAELARAKAALEEEQARGKVAAEEWRLVKNSVAPELGLRKPQLAKEMANVRAADANLARAKRNLARTTIVAPYDGLVKQKQVDIGQFVGTGAQLGTIYGTEIAEVRMPLSDDDLAFLDDVRSGPEDAPAQVILSANVGGKMQTWQAIIARDEGVVDEQSRVVYVVARVLDPYQRKAESPGAKLKFGRFVRAEIQGSRAENLVVLPRSVLRMDGSILTVDASRKLHIKTVTVQRTDSDYVYISDGITAQDLVITSAVPNPVENMAVRLPEDPIDEAPSESSLVASAHESGE